LIVWCRKCDHQVAPDPADDGCSVRRRNGPCSIGGERLVYSRCSSRQTDMEGYWRAPIGDSDAEIEDFLEGFNQPTYRGMGVNGVRVATWLSRDGSSGDTRPDAEWLH